MKVESIAMADTAAQSMRSSSEGQKVRQNQGFQKEVQTNSELVTGSEPEEKKVSASEILDKIKQVSHDGLYSVRFEKNDAQDEFVVQVVDRETDEVIRQIPPEEILGVRAKLLEFTGNIVSSEG
jgi:flagellar protein FlaG